MTIDPATEARRAWAGEHGMFRPEFEDDTCRVGLVAATDGKPSRRVVEAGIEEIFLRLTI